MRGRFSSSFFKRLIDYHRTNNLFKPDSKHTSFSNSCISSPKFQSSPFQHSFSTEASKNTIPKVHRAKLTWKRILGGSTLGFFLAGGVYVSTRDPATISKWQFLFMDAVNPFFRLLDPELSHQLAIFSASMGILPKEKRVDPPALHIQVWGKTLSNPVGLAAGFDKNAEAVEGLLGLGFGFVEIGSVTPVPQEGNPKPRAFRLPDQKAVINRYGFNSQGIEEVAKRLGAQHGKKLNMEKQEKENSNADCVQMVGVNLGKNKNTEDAASDYVQGIHTLSQYADYLVINVSSPNTPGLRKLQGRKQLQDLLNKILSARDDMQWGESKPPPLLVKISPDISKQDINDICQVALNSKVDGLIVSNTTTSRPDSILGLVNADQSGGLSGKPLFELSTQVLSEVYKCTKGKITLVGCGGISNGEDAYKKIRAGASLVQLYTALAYEGPGVIPKIKEELLECLKNDGFNSIEEAIGADHRENS